MCAYIPYPFYHDDVPVDISFLFENEKPAGKHGFLKVQGRSFVFEDGTEGRFWGTNFNGAGCFPEHSVAETLARRLAKLGINIVRFHQLDSEWHTPNIFAFTKGKRVTNARLDPESMDRLDYLVKCLKEQGIYMYMDMFTYRKFRSDEGVANAHALPDAGKPYCNFNKRLIELQKELATELWTHENPYTGLRYCDEPAMVLAEIVNESDLFLGVQPENYVEPYKTEYYNLFDCWKKNNPDGKENEFKVHLQESYYREMTRHLRSIGVKIPITGTNWLIEPDNMKAQLVTDFIDTHHYFYDWRWGEFTKNCINASITGGRGFYLCPACYNAAKDRPTYVSEWDVPWPNEFRADSVLYSAAFGMFQGWSGFAIHTYSYTSKLERMDMLGKEFTADKIGNVPYRQGVFSTWNDPAKFGLFYHGALITRRGDVEKGKTLYAATASSGEKYDFLKTELNCERNVTVASIDGKEDLPETNCIDNGEDVTSETGQLYRNYKKNYGKIDTDMTKCAFGFLEKNGTVVFRGMNVTCKTDFGVIAMSSICDKPISEADNILLTAVGRAKNADAKFEGETMTDIGKPPVLIEVIEAEIEFDTVYQDLNVWAISAEGYYIGTVPTSYENGKFKFSIGETSRSMYYLIVRS